MPDALQTHSKKVRVGLSSAFGAGIHPTFGNTIYQQGSNVTGNLVGTAGAASGSLTVTSILVLDIRHQTHLLPLVTVMVILLPCRFISGNRKRSKCSCIC